MAVTVVNEPVSIHLLIDQERRVLPARVKWRGKTYRLAELGMHHSERRGIKKVHVFTFNVGTLDMRIEIDGESFAATLIAISDGLPD